MSPVVDALRRLTETRKAELEALESLAAAMSRDASLRVTQRTAERVLGLPARTFLGLVREYGSAGGEVLAIGKLRSVSTVHFEKWLQGRSVATPEKVGGEDREDSGFSFERELGLVSNEGRR